MRLKYEYTSLFYFLPFFQLVRMSFCSSDDIVIISRTPAFSSSLFRELSTLRTDFTDFQLITGDKTVDCHRLVIAANSPVLRNMLNCEMEETTRGHVRLDSISPSIIDILVQYMYSGEIVIPKDNMIDMVQAADYLQMHELRKSCLEQFPTVLCPDNVINWFRMADKLHLPDVLSGCSDMMASKFLQVSKSQEFLNLNFTELNSYFQDAQEINPNHLLEASLEWVRYDKQNRLTLLEDLLKSIPLEKCTVLHIKKMKLKHEALMDSNLKVYKMLTDVLIKIADRCSKNRAITPPSFLALIVGGYGNNQCWRLDSFSSPLLDFCQMPAEHCQDWSSFCKTPEGFAVTGGRDSDDCAHFILKTNSWKTLPKLLIKRRRHNSVFVDGSLFVFGGDVKGTRSKSVQFLAMESGLWYDGPDIPEPILVPEVACVERDVFLLNPQNNKLFKLFVDGKSWSIKASLPGAWNYGARMIKVHDQLCVAGGNNKVHAWYTPLIDTWAHAATKPLLQHFFGAMLYHNNIILILGGHNQRKVESYDMDTGVWSVSEWEIPKPLRHLHGLMFR